ncbi:MAG: UvrD-helicase domain-containing protein [Bacteroidales bacterium]|nr:UvrD-helicase domain-containing protein [Bacteroidales bacterium]
MKQSEILEGLNEAQAVAVQHVDGPMMVIAGAGSGKTRVLTHRIAYLISQGVSPFHILALTFTNKAAEEMRNRICQLLGDSNGRNVWMGTFHSIFSKILHIEAGYINFTPKFTIYDTDDSKALVKSILKELNLDDKVYRPTMVLNVISSAKSNLMDPDEYNNNQLLQQENVQRKIPAMGEIYRRYNNRLHRADAMDFDDLLFYMYLLLRDFPELLYKYQHKFQYILVDEYQDTNYVQYQIVRKLAALNENLCVVGDDAQSIYAFRGANIQNILNFKEDYPDYTLYKLEQNYRSTRNILEAANNVIEHNIKQIPKTIWTTNTEGEKIKVLETDDDHTEAEAVIDEIIQQKKENNLQNSDFTILYRNNSQSRPFEEYLRRKGLPYRIYGGMSFYKRAEIKDILAYYRLTINPNDDESLRRIINKPQRGIGLTTMEKVMTAASQSNVSLWNCLCQPESHGLALSPATFKKIDDFIQKIKSYQTLLTEKNAFELGKYIADTSGMTQELRSMEDEPERYENLGELFNVMKGFVEKEPDNPIDMETGEERPPQFPSLDLFMNEVSLLTTGDEDDKDSVDRIKLMTIHAAKGLEFPSVFITGLEENLFPSFMVSSSAELEEERRLFYVAITRAQRHLCLSLAHARFTFGSTNIHEPSRFIQEIDSKYTLPVYVESKTVRRRNEATAPTFRSRTTYSTKEQAYSKPVSRPAFRPANTTAPRPAAPAVPAPESLPLGDLVTDTKQLQTGMRLYHNKFGLGTLDDILETGSNGKVIITFDQFGQKTMLLQFAKLKIVLK